MRMGLEELKTEEGKKGSLGPEKAIHMMCAAQFTWVSENGSGLSQSL